MQANNYFCSCVFPSSYGAGATCGPTTYFVSNTPGTSEPFGLSGADIAGILPHAGSSCIRVDKTTSARSSSISTGFVGAAALPERLDGVSDRCKR